MYATTIAVFILIIANIAFSYQGFRNQSFFEGYKFEVDKILAGKDYKRLVTSGFLHIDWTHLILNMLSLYIFSTTLSARLGPPSFLTIYFAALIGGDLLALFVHRHHGDYSAVGASGAISGVIFAAIALFPGMRLGILGMYIPAWLYGALYVLGAIYGIKARHNIGHDAHLGGALVGMLVALLIFPDAFADNYPTIILLTVPTILFIVVLYKRPAILITDHFYSQPPERHYTIDQRYNAERNQRQQEIDRILDKIHRKGMSSLTKAEKELLNKYSGNV